jgi:hypothetical protein
MALRVARGLFRLWLVLSVLWIGGVGIVTWWTFPVDELVTPAPSSGVTTAPAPAFDPDKWLREHGEAKPAFDPSKPYTVLRAKERWEAVRFASVVALLPPIFLLALGTALVWAFRGFR